LAFALGADAVEPDLVASRDGVLVVRHENEISGTTDVASRPEFTDRRTTKLIDGTELTGWFTEDFTWNELATLRAVERLPALRPGSAAFDGQEPLLRLRDLLEIVDAASVVRPRVLVAELKHATHHESVGLPLDELLAAELSAWASPENLIVESFEQAVLGRVRGRGVAGRLVFLAEASGAPADLVALDGASARSYADHLTDAGLARLASEVDGVSVDKRLLVSTDAAGEGTSTDLVERAHAAGLETYVWTLRAENEFLPTALQRGSAPGDYGDWMTEFRAIVETGVDGVFADQPDLARAALASLPG
jgi:glycerophosphoryl diester phosphodiesterase